MPTDATAENIATNDSDDVADLPALPVLSASPVAEPPAQPPSSPTLVPAAQAAPPPATATAQSRNDPTSAQNRYLWTTIGWISALLLVLLGWWGARRNSRQLALEAQRLSRQQDRLQSAHRHLQAQSARLREQSILDPLTGTLNRQAFSAELRELAGHLARDNRPINLIVFDLDHFKEINDRHGHLVGDAALKLVTGIVREHLISADLFGRFGGDEFLIACADQPLESCRALADSIRGAVEARAPGHQPSLPGLSLSMGLARADSATGYAADELFARADAALYQAKRLGRNRVVVADTAAPSAATVAANRHL